jgi:hypothetical protein
MWLKFTRTAEDSDLVEVNYIAMSEIASTRMICHKQPDEDKPGSEPLRGELEITLKNGNAHTIEFDSGCSVVSCPSPEGPRRIERIADLDNFLGANVGK